MSVVKRIKEYIDFKGITNQKFEIQIGYSNGAFGSQLKNNKTIGSDKLENILNTYFDLNPEWLLTGNGEMLKTNNTMEAVQEKSGVDYKELAESRKETIESLKETLESKNEQIKYLREDNARLKQELANATRQGGNRAAG